MNRKIFLLLHGLLLLYSFSDVFSKLAAKTELFSIPFCLCYGAVILILFAYAVGWQQVIKRMPLSIAFANKAITTVWGTVWGVFLFNESFTVGKGAGILLVMAGIVLYSGEVVAPDE